MYVEQRVCLFGCLFVTLRILQEEDTLLALANQLQEILQSKAESTIKVRMIAENVALIYRCAHYLCFHTHILTCLHSSIPI